MTVRVRNGSTKAMLVVLGYAVSLVVALTIGITTSTGWGVLASGVSVLAFALVFARLFRGENESDGPRPWWRMTAYPPAGYVLAGWFLLQTVGAISAAGTGPAGLVSAVVSLGLAIAYLVSAIRLTAQASRGSSQRVCQ